MAVLRGMCNLNKIEGIFCDPQNRQNGQTFFIFGEGVSFSGVFVTYIRWRVFFHDSRNRQNRQTLPFFLGGVRFRGSVLLIYNEGTFWLTPRQVCQTSEFIFGWVKFWGGLSYWYIRGGFFCNQLAVKITRFLNFFLEQWNFEGGPCYWYITRGHFSVINSPSNLPNF